MKTYLNFPKTPGWSAGKYFFVLLLALLTLPAWGQTDYLVVDVGDLFGLWYSESDWGDYDNDSDLDLLMVGYGPTTGQGYLKFYRNDGNSTFTLLDTPMLGTGNGTCRFADFDNDNDLDALICGQVASGVDTTRVYINTGGVFTDCGFNFPPRVSSSASIGDYDNDGDQDILLTGGTIDDVSTGYIQIFRNDGSFNFTPIEVVTPGIRNGVAEFGDYNSDGWLDIAYTGSAGSGNYVSRILRGSSTGAFTDINAPLAGLRYSKISWLDYDCDGDLDVILSGSYSNEAESQFKLYRYDGSDVFTEVAQPNVLGERQGDLAWGDINNDGYADLIVNGLITTSTYVEKLYIFNPQNGLWEDGQTLTYLKYAAVSLGDYNNNGKLDMSVSGLYASGNYWNKLYNNVCAVANTPPTPPDALGSGIVNGVVYLSWSTGSDAETPFGGLTYNVRVGTTPGGSQILSAMADPATGWRKVARPGNARAEYQLRDLPDGTYYWSVQAIDNAFAGSAFAPEHTFTIGVDNSDFVAPPNIASLRNFPNPFRAETRIELELKAPGRVKADIYNLKGQKVRSLLDSDLHAGNNGLTWDACDSGGNPLPAGIYTVRIQCGTQIKYHKIIHIN